MNLYVTQKVWLIFIYGFFCVFYRMEREKQREKERQSRQQQVSENNVKDKKELFGSPVKVISRL